MLALAGLVHGSVAAFWPELCVATFLSLSVSFRTHIVLQDTKSPKEAGRAVKRLSHPFLCPEKSFRPGRSGPIWRVLASAAGFAGIDRPFLQEDNVEILKVPFTDLYLNDPQSGEGMGLWKRDGVVSPIEATSGFGMELRGLYDKVTASGQSSFSMVLEGVQLRVQVIPNVKGKMVVLRRLPHEIPSWTDIGISGGILQAMMRGSNVSDLLIQPLLARKSRMVLFCGETDSGKSTTLAVLLRWILDTNPWMAVTIEDPAELPLAGKHKQGYCVQRSVERGGFSLALQDALRANPDVILLGEIRDHETAMTALSAAITGHLVLATVHAGDIVQAVRRLIVQGGTARGNADSADQLANCLYCVVHQRLVRSDANQASAAVKAGLSARKLESSVLFSNRAVQTLIRENRVERLKDEIEQQRQRLAMGIVTGTARTGG